MAPTDADKAVMDPKDDSGLSEGPGEVALDERANASGHVQELDRNFSLLNAVGVALLVGSVWPAFGGTILTSLFNGGPPGVIYEFIVVSIFYWAIAASIAELASAIPSSGGVYHWASVTPGSSWGRAIGFFAGYWNWLGWIFGSASMSFIFSNTIVQMYALTHPSFEAKQWHVFMAYIISTWIFCLVVCFFNDAMPHLNTAGIFFLIAGFLITVIVVAVMPGNGGRPPHASTAFVWREWTADIGYPNGFVFVGGMLNGAYSVGAVDPVTHLAEEIPAPQRNVPLAILHQYWIGFVTCFIYIIAIMYAINDYDALFDSPYPIAEIYRQATGSSAGAIGLLCLILFCVTITNIGLYITTGRMLWAMARDGATPFSHHLTRVSVRYKMPFNATFVCAILVTVLGCIYVGSTTAFNAFIGSYVLMSSSSYIAAILPNLLTGRKNITYGPFRLRGILGPILNGIACAYMIAWFVIYCFPYALPVDAKNMNYSCLIWGGLSIFVGAWWVFGARKHYVGPKTTGGINADIENARKASLDAPRGGS